MTVSYAKTGTEAGPVHDFVISPMTGSITASNYAIKKLKITNPTNTA